MGRLYTPAVNQISGPWLLSHENLETLNALFNEIDGNLESALAKTISVNHQIVYANQIVELPNKNVKLKSAFDKNSKLAKITFSDGSSFEASEISEIINHINANSSLSPTELYIKTIHGNHENEFNLIIKTNTDNEKDDKDLEYRIRCLDYDIQLEIKTAIDKWIRKNKSSELLKLWSNSIIYFIRFIAPIVIFISYTNINTTLSKADNYKTELRKEAQKIIEDKEYINNSESTLVLLLKLQSDYVPENLKTEIITVYDKDSNKVFIVSLLIFIFSLIRPRTIIGIGNKYKRYKLYMFWWKYVIVGGLSLIITTLLADYFINFIRW